MINELQGAGKEVTVAQSGAISRNLRAGTEGRVNSKARFVDETWTWNFPMMAGGVETADYVNKSRRLPGRDSNVVSLR